MAVQLWARLVQVRDAALAAVAAAWDPAEPDRAEADWVTEEELATFDGRRVFVLPAAARTVSNLTRGLLLNEYALSVRVLERYTDRSRPTAEWLDARVAFLDVALGALDVVRPADWLLGTLWCETIEVTDACNLDELLGRKLFWAEIEVAYREKATA